jgi:hypothetical protein
VERSPLTRRQFGVNCMIKIHGGVYNICPRGQGSARTNLDMPVTITILNTTNSIYKILAEPNSLRFVT